MRVFAAAAFVIAATVALPARASGPPLLLGVAGCGELDERELRRLVAAELGAIPVEQRGPDVTLVAVHCGGLRVVIRVDDPLSKKTVERSFDTGPLDRRARARWIALAASELVLSSWVELDSNPTPRVQAEGPQVPAPVKRAAQAAVRRLTPAPRGMASTATPNAARAAPIAARTTPPLARTAPLATPLAKADEPAKEAAPKRGAFKRSFRAVGVGSVRSFFDDQGALWGGGLRVSEERFRHMSWSADFLLEAGTLHKRNVDYRIRSGTVGAWLMVSHSDRTLTGRLGAGVRMGVIAALAEDQVEGSGGTEGAVAPWGWPLACSSLSIGVGPIAAELGFEAGYVVLPVGGSSGPSVSGGWFSAQFGLGVRR